MFANASAKTTEMGKRSPALSTTRMVALSLLVGIIGGVGSILFRAMIGLVHNLTFSGEFSWVFNANVHAKASVWGMGIILVPVLGSLVVTWLTQTFAPEARGHGVPEVMDAIYYREGKIRPIVALVKAICSSISIGTGGSVGREGPIIQIGAAFASLVGQVIRMTPRQRIVLIAAGAASGIAATFNAPIGGLCFAVELMLVSANAVNVAVVAVATVVATMISHAALGIDPSFNVPVLALSTHRELSPIVIALFIPFGLLTGAAAALFIHSIYWLEDFFAEAFKNPYLRHMVGMLLLGIMLYLTLRFAGHYYVDGVGYSTIMDILRGLLTHPGFLILLFGLKLLATGLTLGSGASGGVFSPSLFLGATLGAAFAGFLNWLVPGLQVPPVLFAVAGMAAMVGGSTGAVLTAIAMSFEQTRDYADILPIMLSVALCYAVRVRITRESIYTLKLYRRGQLMPQGLQAGISIAKRARNLMHTNFDLVDIADVDDWVQKQGGEGILKCGIVCEEGEISGVVQREVNYLIAGTDTHKMIDKNFIIVSANTSWSALLRSMDTNKATIALVTQNVRKQKPENVIGVITQHEVIQSSHQLAKLLD